MSSLNGTSTIHIELGELNSSTVASETSSSLSSTTTIIIIAVSLVISFVLLIAIIGVWWYCSILTQEDTCAESGVLVQKKAHPKRDQNKNPYIVHKTKSYLNQKTIYFANSGKQNSNQNSRISPKLYNPKFQHKKSQSVLKLKHSSGPSKKKMSQSRNSKVKQSKKSAKWISFKK